MTTAGRTYRLTESGRAASSGDDLSVPGDYRRILALISADTHFDVIRGALRRYPDKLIAEWVEELEEIGYIEAVPTEADFDLDFTKFFAKPAAQAKVTEAGGIIVPPVPAFYAGLHSVDDLVTQTACRILDLFDIDAGKLRRWGEDIAMYRGPGAGGLAPGREAGEE